MVVILVIGTLGVLSGLLAAEWLHNNEHEQEETDAVQQDDGQPHQDP